ncbi:MAG TPA: protein kinase, partial [Blastocatellia bacterium]|nr:protein kinase [Blastocatellia bacterium]
MNHNLNFMTPERWQQIEELFNLVVDMDATERSELLDHTCVADSELRRAVEALVEADVAAQHYLELPALVASEWANSLENNPVNGRKVETTLGHFQIKALLGAGGMGDVYLAEDTRLGRKVALKLLNAKSTGDPERLQRFKREARAASALNHPNIVTIFEIDEIEGESFIATEFIEGETLRQRMNRAPLMLGETLNIIRQIASALREAHAAGIVHRDIKPENVMVRPDGLVKVLDFGLAKLSKQNSGENKIPATKELVTQPGIVMGTVAYMSPEQVRGLDVDERSDVFSLGVMFYEMVTGRKPFVGETASDLMAEILKSSPAPISQFLPAVSPTLETIIARALQKDRDKRYQSVHQLLDDLSMLKSQLEIQSTVEREISAKTSANPAQKGKRKRLVMLAVLAVLVVASAIVYLQVSKRDMTALTSKDWVLLADFSNTTGETVFDVTMKQGLTVALAQSPFINIFPEPKARQTLRLMGRAPDERLTVDVSREICQRQGVKVLLTGSIAPLGNTYVITLEAINARSGDVVARELVEADGKEKVLNALGRAASGLREKLGESLPSIQKFDAPLELTTSSLEALRAFSLGREQSYRGHYLRAISFHRHAVELDPNFAFAYAVMAAMYSYTGQPDQAAAAAKKGFELKDRASELEKFLIKYFYFQLVTGELNKVLETLDLWQQTYPQDWRAKADVAETRLMMGHFEQAAAAASETVRLDSNSPLGHELLGKALIRSNRFAESRQIYEQAIQQKVDSVDIRDGLLQLALINGDDAEAQKQTQWATGQLEEFAVFYRQAEAASFSGQMRTAQQLFRRSIELTEQTGASELAARFSGEEALNAAVWGLPTVAQARAAESLAFSRNQVSLRSAAIALAMSGETAKAQTLAEEIAAKYPKATLAQTVWLPVVRAAIELGKGHLPDAITLLESARQSEPAAEFWINYLLSQCYLRQQKAAQAAAEFQTILDHRGWAPLSALYPLAQLGLAQSLAKNGQRAEALAAYQRVLE